MQVIPFLCVFIFINQKYIPDIYPAALRLNKANTSDKGTSFFVTRDYIKVPYLFIALTAGSIFIYAYVYIYSRKKESVSKKTVDNINNIRRINMKFQIHRAFPNLTIQYQNFTRYLVHRVRHCQFFL